MARSIASINLVGEVMSRGVLSTQPQTPLGEIAALMAQHRVHCLIVDGLAHGQDRQEKLVWGIVSDLDLITALATGRRERCAGDIAATEIVTVEVSEDIEQVVQLMAEHACTHLVVVSANAEPVGVISSLDVADAMTSSIERTS